MLLLVPKSLGPCYYGRVHDVAKTFKVWVWLVLGWYSPGNPIKSVLQFTMEEVGCKCSK